MHQELFFGVGRLKVTACRTDLSESKPCCFRIGPVHPRLLHYHPVSHLPWDHRPRQSIVTICYSRCDSDKSVLHAATLSLPTPKNKSVPGFERGPYGHAREAPWSPVQIPHGPRAGFERATMGIYFMGCTGQGQFGQTVGRTCV